MTNEEKEAIEDLKKTIDYYNKKFKDNEKITSVLIDNFDVNNLYILLNLIQTKQEEIEKNKKIIDLMAIYIDLADENIHKRLKKDDVAYYGSKHCIKEYFINKVEKENK